jgi:hypothetical protein
VSGVLDSDHLPDLLHILVHVSVRDALAPADIYTGWERFRSLTCDLTSPRIQIDTVDEAERAASIASAYRLSTREILLPQINSELPELDRLLQLKQRLRKLWHETRDSECK